MIGLLAQLLRPRCDCGSCRVVFEATDKLLRRQLNAPTAWDDHLSDADLQVLEQAGWPPAVVEARTEELRRMLAVLVTVGHETLGKDFSSVGGKVT